MKKTIMHTRSQTSISNPLVLS